MVLNCFVCLFACMTSLKFSSKDEGLFILNLCLLVQNSLLVLVNVDSSESS